MDLRWRPDDAGQSSVQNRDKLRLGCVVAVVRRLHPDMMPDRFDGVELRAIRWEQAKVETVPLTGQPLPYFGRLMISRVIMDQKHFLSAIASGESVQELCVA